MLHELRNMYGIAYGIHVGGRGWTHKIEYGHFPSYLLPISCPWLSVKVQVTTLSRRKQGFDSPRGRQAPPKPLDFR